MKTILVLVLVIFASSAMAADVVLELTVPDAYTTRLHEAIQGLSDQGRLHCEGTTPADSKTCLEDHLKSYVKSMVRKYEQRQASQAITEIPVN